MFFVIIYSAIDQGYIGLSLASCHKDEIWGEQNWDLYGTISRLWPQLGPIPKFGTSLRALFLLFGFFNFRDQIFRNRDRDFFSETKFSETETETFFRDQICRNRNQDFFSETKFSETLKKLAKLSKPRSFQTEMSISAYSHLTLHWNIDCNCCELWMLQVFPDVKEYRLKRPKSIMGWSGGQEG